MSMRLKDFIALASCISEHNRLAKALGGWSVFTQDQLDTLCACLMGMNPEFKRERWLQLIKNGGAK